MSENLTSQLKDSFAWYQPAKRFIKQLKSYYGVDYAFVRETEKNPMLVEFKVYVPKYYQPWSNFQKGDFVLKLNWDKNLSRTAKDELWYILGYKDTYLVDCQQDMLGKVKENFVHIIQPENS